MRRQHRRRIEAALEDAYEHLRDLQEQVGEVNEAFQIYVGDYIVDDDFTPDERREDVQYAIESLERFRLPAVEKALVGLDNTLLAAGCTWSRLDELVRVRKARRDKKKAALVSAA